MSREVSVTSGDYISIIDKQTGQEPATIQIGEESGIVQSHITLEVDFEDDQDLEVLSFALTKQSEGDTPFIFKVNLKKIDEMEWNQRKTKSTKRLVSQIKDKLSFRARMPGLRNIFGRRES